MQFEVLSPSRGQPTPIHKGTSVVLQQDDWDDFGFKTQYHLYYFEQDAGTFIGNVKILQIGQMETPNSILPVGILQPLDDDFCSLGQSLDYYERLAELPVPVRNEIIEFLRDALIYTDHAEPFRTERGWTKSVTRDMDVDSYSQLALTLLDRNYSALPSVGLEMSFHMAGWAEPLKLQFAAPSPDVHWVLKFQRPPHELPERIAVVTGRNGSGKSTLLARLARVLHATPTDRRELALSRLGSVEPNGIGFTRIIAIAYSAFDTFQVPGVTAEEKRQIIADLRAGTGRYIFAGLRDIARELEEKIDASIARTDDASDEDWFALDRQESTYLKSADQLADEYAGLVNMIFEMGRADLLHGVLTLLLADPSFSEFSERTPSEFLKGSPRTAFKGWSTGHKIVMHIAATIVAHTQPKSIVLLDEPESHLHPPLLAALMHAVRLVLRKNDAFAIVATHSPVVAQETLGRHVSVVNRVEDVVTILSPKIETYGESIGEITDEVFGLSAGATDFHEVLRGFVQAGYGLEDIEFRFDRGLSLQARAYVMSLLGSARQG